MDMHVKKFWRLGTLVLLIGFLWYQQYGLQVTRTQVFSEKLPTAFDGFRIVQLSDLHGRQFGTNNKRLLHRVQLLNPDLIAVTGDLLEEDIQLSQSLSLLTALTQIAPTYFVTGNHEWSLSDVHNALKAIESTGVTVLQNEALLLQRGDQQILLAGVNDPCGPWDQISPQALGAELRKEYGSDLFFLLLAHRNETAAYWASTGADLVLAGHAHGGLIRLPGLGGIIRRHGQYGYDSGLYQSGDTQLFISRGLGGQGMRLFNRPEIALIELLKS